MASAALRNQVATKWQDAFNRLNRGQQGITGLMSFSEVRKSSLFRYYSELSVGLQAWTTASDFLYPRDLGDPPKDFSTPMVVIHSEYVV
jgi:anaphase-promoting complex subunit 2